MNWKHYLSAQKMVYQTSYNHLKISWPVFFKEQQIIRGLWLPRPPDLNARNYYLWETLNDSVYVNNPHSFQGFGNETATISCV